MAVPAFPTVPPPFITAVTIVQRPRLRGMATITTIIIAIAEGGDMFRRRPLLRRRSGAGAADRRPLLPRLLLPAAAGDGD